MDMKSECNIAGMEILLNRGICYIGGQFCRGDRAAIYISAYNQRNHHLSLEIQLDRRYSIALH